MLTHKGKQYKTFNTHIESTLDTIHNKSFVRKMLYQNMIFAVLSLGILSVNPIEFGMQFLEKVPNKFECSSKAGKWSNCTKDLICKSKKHGEYITYRAIQDDPEYLVNWVDKLGLLCESH